MKILIQRVTKSEVKVEGKIVGAIGPGLLVFIGIAEKDTPAQAVWLAHKLADLRILKDRNGKLNQSLLESKGKALIVSQFTLYADCTKGRRPSFLQSASPALANELYERFIEEVRKRGIVVEMGVFAADMEVSLVNDGPVTLLLER